ncbi:MAG: ABC transporter ATP-binding protein/permease, partial [Oscillospiraceae bacterium]|nr:ABC transporter ATP-binding protein/permease [Oscillospiraceae bacterium]
AALQDNLTGIKEIQLWRKEKHEYSKILRHSQNHAKSLIKALLYMAIMNPLVGFLINSGNLIVVAVGGYLVIGNHGMSIDEIVAFLMYLSVFYSPVASITLLVENMQAGLAGGERVFEILETQADITDSPGARDAGRLTGKIEFRNVAFRYADEPSQNEVAYTLKDVSFTVPEKKTYAVIGQTGVGKTTLAALLPRFYDVTDGEILIDGIPIKNMTLQSLRSNISMVLQDVFLWGGTLRENIAYGNPNASGEEIISAAKTACIHDFITGLPNGYDTVVGERGIRLSGGQKQRISIARSLLCNAPILILDEATSSVDTETEHEIQNAISKITGSKTLLIIAHRLSTVKRADCIIVLKDGTVAQMGTHTELMKEGGIYRHLVEVQSIKE